MNIYKFLTFVKTTKMKTRIILLLLLIIPIIHYGQNDTIFNQTDNSGLKQGFWKKYYPNGNVQYTGKFINNKPVGEFKRFDQNGNLLVIMNYTTDNDKVYSTFYHSNKKKQAEGYYIGKLKDSIWNYYSEDEKLINSVPYQLDIKNGTEIKYYNNQAVFEKIEWKKGVQDGKDIRYYDNGNVMIRSTYSDGMLNGIYLSYTIDNTPITTGNYENNKRQGKWIFYDEQGKVKSEINYIDGVAENQEELEQLEQYELDQLEKNKGKFTDPANRMYNENSPM
ncbi:MAG: hypothetical protein A2X13_02910 [Bacteroidetes bacterium GWC2_33_15]|nr:MAG: hypothetical protein A2X10_09445 [Bacteroidetes bacterium GWA2_33_15]OFX49501.1 MAG: hypothetical protein A2X13_02910 [Bacteroidetes bacterium GWC2_33_15]OFX63660.1 MAG: hypothetical protein A2X15_01315 [Bacteroidetes bacterium GWB2_32_14]OFX68874.1 MAG: hypothetical protein A2X14_13310 [Bacteroidetes bacterium GWD2_33_33]HAN17524.1 hypothetical protein [Bacteroidales bacterium]